MTHARNRPPTAPRGGRPQKGPRPVASKSEQLLTDLRAASAHLRATDAPALAATVEGLLGPKGWGQLRRAVEADLTPRNTAISIDKALHATYQKASEKAGSDLTTDVIEALQKYVDEDFSPTGYPRRQPGSGENVTLNARIPNDLKAKAEAVAKASKTTIGHVVKAYLAHKYAQPAK